MALERLNDAEEVLVTIGGVPVETTGLDTVDDFLQRPDDMPPCCQETLGNATESLAFLARNLVTKAEATLDKARATAEGNHNAGDLVSVARAYLELAEAIA